MKDITSLSDEELFRLAQPSPQATATPDIGSLSDQELLALAGQSTPSSPSPRSLSENIGRGIGLDVRRGIEGAAAIPTFLADIPAHAINAGGKLGQLYADKVLGKNVEATSVPLPSQLLSEGLTKLGLPEPETPQERINSDITNAVGGSLGASGLGKMAAQYGGPLAQKVGNLFANNAGLQAASSGTGALAAGGVRESGGTEGEQLAAALLGGVAPSTLMYGPGQALRSLMGAGGKNAERVRENIAAFEAAGTTPTIGQATESRIARALESALTRTPGSAGIMVKKAENQAKEIGNRLEELASQLSPKTTSTNTGRLIEKGIRGEGGFVDQFRSKQGELYDKLGQYLKPETPVAVQNVNAALAGLTADVPGAPNISQYFKNPRIQGIAEALKQDANANMSLVQGGNLPYQGIKQLRTLVGQELTDNPLVSDVPRAQWKQLYGGLSEDMRQAAQQAGPEAINAFNRANTYTKAGMNRIELLDKIVGQDTPEKVFQAAISGTKEGATNLRAVMQSLPEEGQKAVSATVIRRLGLANPSNQNELGEAFSTQTFLTNYNKLSNEAKQALFQRYGKGFTNDMNHIAKVANNLREGSKVFANPSGTSQALSNQATLGGIVLPLLMGNPGVAAGIAGGVATANIAARAMTNPNIVRWLAKNVDKPAVTLPVAINNLYQWASQNNDPEASEFAETLQQSLQGQ